MKAIHIARVHFDAARRRFEAEVLRAGRGTDTRRISIPGDLRWSHQRTVRALVEAAARA